MELGTLNIPKSEIEAFAPVHNFQTRLYLQYSPLLTTDTGRKLLEKLRRDPRVTSLEGKMLSRGSSAHRFQVEELGMWLLWRANESDLASAQCHLEAFLDSEEITVLNTLWVLGVEVDQPISLADEYMVQPADAMPDSWDKESFLQFRFEHAVQVARPPACAITKPCKVPKTHPCEPTSIDEDSEFWKASRRLRDIGLLLNAVDGVACVPYYSTSYVDPTTPVGPFGGSGGGSGLYDVLAVGSTKLESESAKVVEDLLRSYEALEDGERARMQRILDRLSQAKRRGQIEDKILDLGIALEMLLLDDNSANDQLALSFRLRGSWLLGNSVDDRVAVHDQLRDIYRYRSQVAHSGVLCKGRATEINRVRESFPEYQRVAEVICQRSIVEGRPDWKRLVLGAI